MKKLRQSIAENGGFRHWFANVYWYHYKFVTIAAVVALTVVVYMTIDAIRTPKYDAKIAVIATRSLTEEQFTDVRQAMADALGDTNGDGQVHILFRIANLADEEYASEYREVFYTCLSDEDYVIYLMDDYSSALYSSSEMAYFDNLSELGIEPDADNPCRRSFADSELMQEAKASDLYLCMIDRGLESDDEDMRERSEQALAMVRVLLGEENQ